MENSQIGAMIRFHRKMSGLSQHELAKFAGLGKTVIYDLEKGKLSIRFDTLLKVMHVLNIKLEFDSQLMHLFRDQNEKS